MSHGALDAPRANALAARYIRAHRRGTSPTMPAPTQLATDSALDQRRWDSIGRLFFLGHEIFASRVEAKVQASGFPDFAGTLATLVRIMRQPGSRVGDLAARARMSSQGMGQIVAEMTRRGYVRTEADPADGRARIVIYTPRGRRLAQTALAAVEEVEREYRRSLGAKRFEHLNVLLGALVDGLPEAQAYAAGFLEPRSAVAAPQTIR